VEAQACGLYIHIPWCVRKCPYCDFNSHAVKDEINEALYLKALIADFEEEIALSGPREITSIFFGGGTPSILSGNFYQQLLPKLEMIASFSDNIEITLEANPGTADAENFKTYRQAGINRLSLGFQSMENEKLKALGRIHDVNQAYQAIDIARAAGFENINIDLMFALPSQTVQQSLDDLKKATDLYPSHLSWYQLTMEPNTAFFANPPKNVPDNDLSWEIQKAGQQWLKETGYSQYEISAYSQQDKECQHNLNYWLFGDYLGIGAGAHGKVTSTKGVVRRSKKRHPNNYSNGPYLSQEKELSEKDLILEFMMNTLRLNQGFTEKAFNSSTGLDISIIKSSLKKAQSKQLLVNNKDSYYPTELGHRFLNDLLGMFL